jgi:cytoskeletal protein CcmA (bactofilin family)
MGWRSRPDSSKARRDQIENVLGRSSLVRGNLSADGAFRIDGWVEGSVESRSIIVIGESGAVRGNVTGSEIIVAGKIMGNVVCSGQIEILATGRIEGDIDAKKIRIETGGIFRGTSHMKCAVTTTVEEELGEVGARPAELSPVS